MALLAVLADERKDEVVEKDVLSLFLSMATKTTITEFLKTHKKKACRFFWHTVRDIFMKMLL